MKKFLNLNGYGMAIGYNFIYYSLNEFINDYKQNYHTKREQKINNLQNEISIIDYLTFDNIFHHFISWFLYDLKIGKNEKISLIKYDDKIVIYSNENKYEYIFMEFN